MINQDFPQAVTLYKEALDLVKEHSDDFRLDPLLNIHIYHNLAEALLITDNISTEESASENCEEKDNHVIEKAENDNLKEEMRRCNSSSRVTSDDLLNVPLSLLKNGDRNSAAQPQISIYIQQLTIACEDLKQKFLSLFSSKLSLAQQEFRRSYEQVCFHACRFPVI